MHEFQLQDRLRLFPKISATEEFLEEFQTVLGEEDAKSIQAAIMLLKSLEMNLMHPQSTDSQDVMG